MKKPIFLLIVCALMATKANAQYQPLLDADTIVYNMIIGGVDDYFYGDILLAGDTIIADETNRKAYFRAVAVTGPDYIPLGYMREDTSAQQLWYRPADSSDSTYLVADFALEVGDAFLIDGHYTGVGPSGTSVIVDSVYVENGLKIIEFDQASWFKSVPFQFISGAGASVSHLFQTGRIPPSEAFPDGINSWVFFVCSVFKDGALFYELTDNVSCLPPSGSSIRSVFENNHVKIFPNPVQAGMPLLLEFEKALTAGLVIELHNASGQRVLSQRVAGASNKVEVDLPDLIPGTYFVTAINEGNMVTGFVGTVVID